MMVAWTRVVAAERKRMTFLYIRVVEWTGHGEGLEVGDEERRYSDPFRCLGFAVR